MRLTKSLIAGWILLAVATHGLVQPGYAHSPESETQASPGGVELENHQGVPIGRVYCTGNNRTRDRVILREVLQNPGDPLDPERIRETERNLRGLPFLGSVRVIPHPNPEQENVDLEIAVTDTWPWVGAVIPSFAGGQREVVVILANGNFRGLGQEIGFFGFLSNEVADSYSVFMRESRLFGSRWTGSLQVGRQGDIGNQHGLEVSLPFYSLSTPWSYNVSAFDETQERILYRSGIAFSDYFRKRRGGAAGARRSFQHGNRRWEAGLQYVYRDDEHQQETGWNGIIPADKERGRLVLELTGEKFRFVEDSFINQMGQVEDQRLGVLGAVRLGGAARVLGSDSNYPEVGAGFRWFDGKPGGTYVLAATEVNTRYDDDRLQNTVLVSTVRLYQKLSKRGLLAWQGQLSVLDRMEDPDQLLLDSPNGLRGYEANSFEGTRRLLTNLEWRRPFWDPGWMAVGSAVFVDGGIIWSESRPLKDAPFLTGVGAGLRIGFPGFLGAPVMRLDLGYGLRTENLELSFGFGQRFGDEQDR